MSAPICAHCRNESTARFEITQFDRANTNKGTVTCCSLACLLQWAYASAMMKGAQAAFGFKNAVTMLLDTIKSKK